LPSLDPTTVEPEIGIAARPGTVFAFLIAPDRVVQWLGAAATINARPGGGYRIPMHEHHLASGRVRTVEPPHRLTLSWGWEDHGPDPWAAGTPAAETAPRS